MGSSNASYVAGSFDLRSRSVLIKFHPEHQPKRETIEGFHADHCRPSMSLCDRSSAYMNQPMDYRESHLARGTSYDRFLADEPFSRYMTAVESRLLHKLIPELFPNGIGRYLDFACGTGRVTEVIAPFAKESVGVDISPSMIAGAQAKLPHARFVKADLTREESDLGRFDLISSFRFFGNAQPDLRIAALRALHARLSENGLLLINSHRNPRSLAARAAQMTGAAAETDLHFSKLRTMLAATGFEIARAYPIGAWQFRARVMNNARPDGFSERILERLFGFSWLVPIAPDAIVVARRR